METKSQSKAYRRIGNFNVQPYYDLLTKLVRVVLVLALVVGVTSALDVLIPMETPVSPPGTFLLSNYLSKHFVRLSTCVAVIFCILNTNYASYLPYYLTYIIPYLTWYGANVGNYWSILWLILGVEPLLEFISGEDKSNPTEEESKELNKKFGFKFVTLLWVPTQIVFLCWACWAISVWKLTTIEFLLFAISVGFNTGIGINVAHELIHKPTRLEVNFGKALLVSVCYGHWYVEHIWGHHKYVSTPYDPATARQGESFYSFWLRSVYGGFWSAWEIEKKRLSKKELPLWSLNNQIIVLSGLSVLTAISILFIFGTSALIMFLMQSVVAFSLLEIINYIEHYGLSRELKGKDYEPVNVTHSWNADAKLTNYFLFKLQRHSDHHAHAGRRYQILRSFEESPQMPTGYAGMITLATVPPLWFYFMDKKVQEWKKNFKK